MKAFIGFLIQAYKASYESSENSSDIKSLFDTRRSKIDDKRGKSDKMV